MAQHKTTSPKRKTAAKRPKHQTKAAPSSSEVKRNGGRKRRKTEGMRKATATATAKPRWQAKSPRRYSPRASEKIQESMHEMKEGKLRSGRSGKKVRSRRQAIAIGLAQARREGAKVPAPLARQTKRKTRAPNAENST